MKKILLATAILSLIAGQRAYSQLPVLSSYPSAPSVIFLDFDGQAVEGTGWNANGPIYCGPSGLSNAQITEIFNRVSEDYRPFNLNITTDSARYLAAPVLQRMRVIITVTSEWNTPTAGGISFVNSFSWGDDTPAFVFSALLNYNTKNIAEAVSHEAGHTLGLYHQASYNANCTKISDYNYGQGAGEIGWAPIMGIGYYQNLTLWNNGPTPFGCANVQNDLDMITSGANGFTYRNDDYAATFTGASNAVFAGNQFNVSGIIERNSDQDMFKFTTGTGRFQLNAVPFNVGSGDVGSDLDMQVTLYNSSQAQLNVYNPGMLLNSVIDTFLSAGTYYLKIEGKGNVYASNYASLGSYSLHGNFTAAASLPVHQLQLQGSAVADKHQLKWIIEADEAVKKQTLEISADDRNFVQLTDPLPADRAYIYKPFASQPSVFYRLHVWFDNNMDYYSNTIVIRMDDSGRKTKVVNTVVTNGILNIHSEGPGEYNLIDMSGKLVKKGILNTGTSLISLPELSNGMYIVFFKDGREMWSEKIIKQ